MLLGIGPDGHTASLFPGQSTLSERRRLVVGVPEAGLEPFVPRISMTIPALTASQRIVILASGREQGRRHRRGLRPRLGARPAGAVLAAGSRGQADHGAARPRRRLRTGSAGALLSEVIGVDLGGTKVAVARLVDGKLSESTLEPTQAGDTDALIDQLAAMVDGAAQRWARRRRRRRALDRRVRHRTRAARRSTCRCPTCRCVRCSANASAFLCSSTTTPPSPRWPRPTTIRCAWSPATW